MLIKCIKNYFDLELKRSIKVNETIDVTEARAKELCSVDNKAGFVLCELVPTTEKVAKKGRTKKEV